MDIDTIIEKGNGMGRFQKILLLLTLVKEVYASFHMLGLVFISLAPEEVDCNRRVIVKNTYYSIVNEWLLICDKAYFSEMAQSICMCGVLIGAMVFGPLSDRFGRRRILFISYLGEIVTSCGSSFAKSYNQFVVLRFGLGFFCQGVGLTSFTLLMEVVGAEQRAWCGIFVQVCFALGIPVMALLAYLSPGWRVLTLAYGLVGVAALPFYRCVLESPRWLAAQRREEAAEATLRTMARRNGMTEEEASRLRLSRAAKAEEEGENLLSVARHPRLRVWTLLCLLCWVVNSGVYYGLTLLAGKIGASRYLSVAFSGLVELPSNLVTPWLMRRFGRRPTLNLFMYGAAACCLSIVLLSRNTPLLVIVLATLGKLCISGSFSTAYVYTSELYPTSVRSASLGLASTAARVGGILAPFVLLLGGSGSRLPFVVFGVVTIVSSTLNWKLPETNNKPMVQSVVEC